MAIICGMTAMAQNRPTGTHQTTGGDRGSFLFRLDQPTLVYDDVENLINVYGSESSYYDYNIKSQSTQMIIAAGTLDGNFDTIDATPMAVGTYIITLTSAAGHEFQWLFDGELKLPNSIDGIDKKTDFERTNNVLEWGLQHN